MAAAQNGAFDVIIGGGGHNGLVAANYPGRAGQWPSVIRSA